MRVLLVATVAVVIGACGGDDERATPGPPPTTTSAADAALAEHAAFEADANALCRKAKRRLAPLEQRYEKLGRDQRDEAIDVLGEIRAVRQQWAIDLEVLGEPPGFGGFSGHYAELLERENAMTDRIVRATHAGDDDEIAFLEGLADDLEPLLDAAARDMGAEDC